MSLRLYFHHAAKTKRTNGWRGIFRPPLARHLLAHASQAGIDQVILHRVQAGYIKGGRLRHHHVDASHRHLPHCLELIDIESKLRRFLAHHAEHLLEVKAVLLPCEVHEPQGLRTDGPFLTTMR